MATSWKSQQGNGEYSLQFETDNKEKYKLVEKAAQMAMDGKTIADVSEVKHGEWARIANFGGGNCFCYCSVCGIMQKAENATELKAYKRYCSYCGAKMDGGEK